MTEKTFDCLLWTVFGAALLAALWFFPQTSGTATPVDPLVTELGLAGSEPLDVLVLQQSTASLDRFMGRAVRNTLHPVGSAGALIASLGGARRWDVVAVLVERSARDPRLDGALTAGGYLVLYEDAQSLVALPERRVRLQPVATTDALAWQPFASPAAATLDAVPHHPAIASASPVDAGFMSQPLPLEGRMLVEARVAGTVTGTGAHAAHLSVLGKQPMLLIGPGTYEADQRLRTVVDVGSNPGGQARIAFGLGGWTAGAGRIRLEQLTLQRIEIVGASVSGRTTTSPRPAEIPPPIVFAFTVAVLLASAYLGQRLLRSAGATDATLLGSGLLFGLCLLSAALILSLRALDTQMVGGAVLGAVLVVVGVRHLAMRRRSEGHDGARRPRPSGPDGSRDSARLAGLDVLIKLTVAAWLAYIAFLFFPLQLTATAPQYPFPRIFDLPKHLFAVRALFDGTGWAPENPFFAGETFAYNFGFYMPAAFVAKLLGSRVATLQTFAITILAVALALPLVTLELTRLLTRSRGIQLACVLLATWVGGITPVWLSDHAGLGAFLYNQHFVRSAVWAEEMFTYVMYVPQHVFAALCTLLSMRLLLGSGATSEPDREVERMGCAAVVVFAGAVASLLILPYLVVSYFVAGLFVVAGRFAGPRRHAGPKALVAAALAFVAPLVLLLPFVVEAAHWSGGDPGLVTWPILSVQWFYIATSFGIVVLLALVAVPALVRRQAGVGDRRFALGIAGVALLGLGGILTGGGHADAGIKAALLLRLTLVPLAGVGLLFLQKRLANDRWFVTQTVAALCAATFAVNLPMLMEVGRSALARVDPASGLFLEYVRALPGGARIVMFSIDQSTVATAARPIDFDFSSARPDSYLPPAARQRVKAFWDGIAAGSPGSIDALKARYDFAIAPVDSSAYRLLSKALPSPAVIGGNAIFRTHGDGG